MNGKVMNPKGNIFNTLCARVPDKDKASELKAKKGRINHHEHKRTVLGKRLETAQKAVDGFDAEKRKVAMLQRELKNPGFEGWTPRQNPEFL